MPIPHNAVLLMIDLTQDKMTTFGHIMATCKMWVYQPILGKRGCRFVKSSIISGGGNEVMPGVMHPLFKSTFAPPPPFCLWKVLFVYIKSTLYVNTRRTYGQPDGQKGVFLFICFGEFTYNDNLIAKHWTTSSGVICITAPSQVGF